MPLAIWLKESSNAWREKRGCSLPAGSQGKPSAGVYAHAIELLVYYYRPKTNPDDAPIQDMLTKIGENIADGGFWKMYHFIRGQAHLWNHKRIYRIYM